MKNPHKKYTYEWVFVCNCEDTTTAVDNINDATDICVWRKPIEPDVSGRRTGQWLLDIPLSEVQLPAPTPAKHQPRTKAELIASLRHLSEDMSDLFEAMRYFAQDSHDISEWCRQLSNLAILPKAWAEMLEEGNAK